MKHLFLFVILSITSFTSYSQIDQVKSIADTMVFDLDNAVISTDLGTTYYDLPVYAIIPSGISSFDFWFQFNESEMTYDSTIVIINELDAFSNFNINNHNLSNTTSGPDITYNVPTNTVLLKLRFILASASTIIDTSDFSAMTVLFNGIVSSYKFNYTGSNAAVNDLTLNTNLIQLFPNPATEKATLIVDQNATATLLDLNGKIVQEPVVCEGGKETVFAAQTLSSGTYYVKIQNGNSSITKQLTIIHQ
jgi:hypothetical protein